MGKAENAVVVACLNVLALRRVFAWHQSNLTIKGRAFHGMKGVPDLLAVIAGRCIGFECKTAGGRLSIDQILFKSKLLAAGGAYFVVHSGAETLAALDSLKEDKP